MFMGKSCLLLCILATCSLALPRIAVAQTSDELQQQFDTAIAAVTKTRDDALAKVDETHKANIEAAKNEVRKTFEPLFKGAKPEAAETYTQKMNAILSVDTAVGMARITGGRDPALLVGKWVSADWDDDNFYRLFDFTSDKSMTYSSTIKYSSSSTGQAGRRDQYSSTIEYNIKVQDGKVIISPVTPTSISFPGVKTNRSSKETERHRFEIPIPFNPDRPEMIFTCTGNTITIPLKRDH